MIFVIIGILGAIIFYVMIEFIMDLITFLSATKHSIRIKKRNFYKLHGLYETGIFVGRGKVVHNYNY